MGVKTFADTSVIKVLLLTTPAVRCFLAPGGENIVTLKPIENSTKSTFGTFSCWAPQVLGWRNVILWFWSNNQTRVSSVCTLCARIICSMCVWQGPLPLGLRQCRNLDVELSCLVQQIPQGVASHCCKLNLK